MKSENQSAAEYDLRRSTAKSPMTIVSPGVAALGADKVKCLVDAICIFDDFNIVSRSYEVNFADVFLVDGIEILFWIDHFDETLTQRIHPSDPNIPVRRIVMLSRSDEGWTWSLPIKKAGS
jgi:hypothetical protein